MAVQAIGAGGGSSLLHFKPAREMETRFVEPLRQGGRMQEVTLPFLLRAGAREFCWVAPGESLGEGWSTAEHGAFCYGMGAQDPPLVFKLVDPVSVAAEESRARENLESSERAQQQLVAEMERKRDARIKAMEAEMTRAPGARKAGADEATGRGCCVVQ